MIKNIAVVLGGKEYICTVKELKTFQKELNELFPTETLESKLKEYPLTPLREFYQGLDNGISLQQVKKSPTVLRWGKLLQEQDHHNTIGEIKC